MGQRNAWLEFIDVGSAQRAISLDGHVVKSGPVRVSSSKTPIHSAGWVAEDVKQKHHLEQRLAGAVAAAGPTAPAAEPPGSRYQ
jgi:hypothetical protein